MLGKWKRRRNSTFRQNNSRPRLVDSLRCVQYRTHPWRLKLGLTPHIWQWPSPKIGFRLRPRWFLRKSSFRCRRLTTSRRPAYFALSPKCGDRQSGHGSPESPEIMRGQSSKRHSNIWFRRCRRYRCPPSAGTVPQVQRTHETTTTTIQSSPDCLRRTAPASSTIRWSLEGWMRESEVTSVNSVTPSLDVQR